MTLKDIAKEAGVSIMTVSNVINGKDNRVSKSTKKKITSIIEKHNYIPNSTARSLSVKSSKIILVVLPYLEEGNVQNYYITTFLSYIQNEISKRNYFVMLYSTNDYKEISFAASSWNVDGIIFLLSSVSSKALAMDKFIKKPLVLMDYYSEEVKNKYLNVYVDDFKGGYTQTKYLIDKGHEKIAFAGLKDNSLVLQQRFLGYEKAMEDNNIKTRKDMIYYCNIDFESGVKLGNALIKSIHKQSAIVCTSDLLALGIMESYRQKNLKLPQDLSIIGFDDLDLCKFVTPSLTSISQNIRFKAQETVNLLIDNIENISKNKVVKIDVNLVERESVYNLK
ncbi:MAG: LacI family DNA-binding transcriptional regulator [Lachnospirales bacterium]